MFLYHQLSTRFVEMISAGTLQPGDKLPSVRVLSKEQGVSQSTAFQCYIDLENKGLVESRPRSGYYVKFNPAQISGCTDTFVENPQPVHEIDDMITTVLQHSVIPNMTHFSINAPSEAMLPLAKMKRSVHHVLNNYPQQALSYERPEGNEGLRKQIARLVFDAGAQITPSEVIITNGCLEAINLALQATTNRGDRVAIESPTYYGIHQALINKGLEPVEIETHTHSGIDLQVLERHLVDDKIRVCVFVTNFGNPLGACVPEEKKKQLVQLIQRYNVKLIEVDIYGSLHFDDFRPKTCKAYDTADHVILCSSVSKSLAPGYRVGWIIAGKEYRKVLHLKLNQSVASPTLTQAAVAHFMENGRYDLHIRALRKALYMQSLRYLKAIHDYFPDDVRVTQPKGGYVFWVSLKPGANTWDIYHEALKWGISFAPGQIFSKKYDFSNYMRISFGLPFTPAVDQALKTLGDIVRSRY
ncbi:GntR family transcriptional regulator YdcR [Fulvivirga imtechensis AK7]|uniref:GntR family transcriptional regulator YdcR n=1 Tax=Fulvivirga imtechensis AK7 TaxID=1237149 RepID=L8K0Q8_9BACT|nr:PLP-dependent aminotransferase family protein [Fulvivirga imtechensis]ELR73509.1 GntR family transcriptional regulator YdcR [Fulvivirga imtechensis AK7]